MAKANLVLAGGTKVAIEGTEEEVARLLARFHLGTEPRSVEKKSPRREKSKRESIGDLVEHLVVDGFFAKPVDLGAIKATLEQQGHYFARSAIPTQLLRLVKRRELRRIKQNGKWHYVR